MFDIAYFFKRTGFVFTGFANVLKHSLDLVPYGKALSTITVEGRLDYVDEMLVCIDEYAWLVNACNPSDSENTTTFTLLPLYWIFDRDILYVAQSDTSMQILTDIYNEFTNNGDLLFRESWIQPAGTSAGAASVVPAVSEWGYYNLREYIDSAASAVIVDYKWTNSGIYLYVLDRGQYTAERDWTYDTDSGKEQLERAVYKRDLISKLTYYNKADGSTTDYYLLTDGTVTTDASAPDRARGRWILYAAEDVNIGLITAQFARSEYSHSIELYTSQGAPLYYANCRIRLPSGTVLQSRVTSVVKKSGDERYLVKLGRAATKLTEIIQEVHQNHV